ncbi:MAG: amidophosphoribosyltransferase [Chloroflexi bacterium]|nr:amidophosphoribosyltransferase [Chloroflexota bacterium]
MGGDGLHEACGVFGVYGPGEDVARLTFFGLYALQHRGQESAGIATADGTRLHLFADMGLVNQVFSEENLANLRGHIAIGHSRYSTTGSSCIENAQPIRVESDLGTLAFAHNGNLVNTSFLADQLQKREDVVTSSITDSELMARLIASAPGATWIDRIRRTLPVVKGAYSLVMLTSTELIAVRDPFGIRPLCLGRLGNSWVVASESCALDTIGAELLREILPGEIICIDENGPRSYSMDSASRRALCVFEYIYFARPDSVIEDTLVYLARERMGERLAKEQPIDADLVIGVPDGGIPAAVGYARSSGLPYREGFIKNRYIGRTFIQPDQRLREEGVALKLNPLPDVLKGKRVVMVDDSIVRGTTKLQTVAMLRRAGAKEVHVRITAPPMVNPCYLGIDTARRHELIAASLSVPEICEYIGADTLGYLSRDGLMKAIGLPESTFCDACFTGNYPMEVQLDLDKLVLEAR